MAIRVTTAIDLGQLPFHVGMSDFPTNAKAPDTMPFQAGFREDLNLLVQRLDSYRIEVLKQAYAAGSQICTAIGETELGQRYFKDFWSFLSEVSGGHLNGLDVLEIGCGRGYLLNALSDAGARVVGIDPDTSLPQRSFDSPVVVMQNNFSSSLFSMKFDMIIHYAVLEHSFDPALFMSEQLELLKPSGQIVFSVPDCSYHIEHGDISMFAHEHIQYFNEPSLGSLAVLVGAEVQECRKASDAGSLLSVWRRGSRKRTPSAVKSDAAGFASRTLNSLSIMNDFVTDLQTRDITLGIFCPGRFINYHYLLRDKIGRVRYFDDNASIWGKFFPPLEVRVESRQNLLISPVDVLVIMSRFFGTEISRSLKALPQLRDTDIVGIDELF